MSPRRCRVWAATPGWDDALELCDVDGDDVGVEGDGVAGGDEGGRAVGVEGLADGEDGLAQGGATAVGGQVIPEQGDELFAGMGCLASGAAPRLGAPGVGAPSGHFPNDSPTNPKRPGHDPGRRHDSYARTTVGFISCPSRS
jgi:hypothetical protein